MTRQHFESLAAALKNSKPHRDGVPAPLVQWHNDVQAALAQWHNDVQAVADACSGWNPGFQRGRFLQAADALS